MSVTSRVGLWLEQCVEVPERALHELGSRHLFEATQQCHMRHALGGKNQSTGAYPISSSIDRNSVRTFNKGCKWPPLISLPLAARLRSLNSADFHSPLGAPQHVTRAPATKGSWLHLPIQHVAGQLSRVALPLGGESRPLGHRPIGSFTASDRR